MKVEELLLKMQKVFTPEQVEVLAEFIKFLDQLVKATDFLEVKEAIVRLENSIDSLRDVVRELAEAQRRTDEELREYKKVTEQRFAELTEAQRKTEEKLAELAEAQRRTEEELREYKKVTEQRFAELADELKKTQGILQQVLLSQKEMNKKLGGIDLTMGYMLENEAYRNLPTYLEKNLGIKVISRVIRKEVQGKEVNLLAEGQRNGKKVLIVGEAKSRLSIGPEKAREVFEELEEKIKLVMKEYSDYKPEDVVPVIITHFASKSFLEEANKQGYIVVQSFEW